MTDITAHHWQIGQTLTEAMLAMASDAERQTYIDIDAQSPHMNMVTQFLSAWGTEKMNTFQNNAATQAMRTYTELRSELRRRILLAITQGDAKAFGFAQPREAHHIPIEIPLDLWNGDIDWKNSTISNNGLTILAVRVVWPTQIISEPPPIPDAIAKQVGRPSLSGHIKKALEALDAEGRIDYSKSLKAYAPVISAWLARNYPKAMGNKAEINYTTIQKAIGSDFQLKKMTLKSSK